MSKTAVIKQAVVQRVEPLDGLVFATNGVTITPMSAAIRINLRVRADGLAEAKKILGVALPQKPKTSTKKGDVQCFWIGPDEWLILDVDGSTLPEKFAKAGNGKFSAVDVSHRNTGIIVSGLKAADVINSGCPQDLSLSAFPAGAASRTLLGKSEIVLVRISESEFRIECWRSFSDYVWKYLTDAVKSV
jgi:sarcosine oxidase subunit gamma